MTYAVFYDRRVIKDLDAIPNQDIERIRRWFQALSQNPLPPGAQKLAGVGGGYRVRQGDYRILYTVDHEKKAVHVHAVGHRRDVYRGL